MRADIFKGRDSARTYYAERTNQRSGEGFETTYSGPSVGSLIWQLLPFIGVGLMLIGLFGGRS